MYPTLLSPINAYFEEKRKLHIINYQYKQGDKVGTPPPTHTLSKVGDTSGFVPPLQLLDKSNVLISLFTHILWLKTQFFTIFLARLARQIQFINIFQTLLA